MFGAKGKRGSGQPPDAALTDSGLVVPYCRTHCHSFEQVWVPLHTPYTRIALGRVAGGIDIATIVRRCHGPLRHCGYRRRCGEFAPLQVRRTV